MGIVVVELANFAESLPLSVCHARSAIPKEELSPRRKDAPLVAYLSENMIHDVALHRLRRVVQPAESVVLRTRGSTNV